MDRTITTPQGRRIALRRQPGQGPAVVFVHGFMSDMGGTKAEDLAVWCAAAGRAFVALDLSGHGASGGDVAAFGPADWLEDVIAVLDADAGPAVIVGSSLGGWLALLLARAQPGRVRGLVTIAAAPDFTERMACEMTAAEHAALAADGVLVRPSDYGGDYRFSARLFAQGRAASIFGAPLALPMPVRMLQGTADADVPIEDAMRLLAHAEGPDIRLTLVKGADHRFSTPDCLALVRQAVAEVSV